VTIAMPRNEASYAVARRRYLSAMRSARASLARMQALLAREIGDRPAAEYFGSEDGIRFFNDPMPSSVPPTLGEMVREFAEGGAA
jgi:hypothetical protein